MLGYPVGLYENVFNENKFVLYLELIDYAGGLKEALVLSEIIRRLHHAEYIVMKDDIPFIAIPRKEWKSICGLSPKEYDRAINKLIEKNIVFTRIYKDKNGNPVTHIAIAVKDEV